MAIRAARALATLHILAVGSAESGGTYGLDFDPHIADVVVL